MQVCISGVGVGIPSHRLSVADINAAWSRKGGRGQIAICGPDEDALTLAWSAANTAIAASGFDSDQIDGLWWGTTRPPFAEGPNHSILGATLSLRSNAVGCLTTGSHHAGIDALFAAADAVAAGTVRTAVVVMSDAQRPGVGTTFEARCGAGAAAVVLVAESDAAPGSAVLGARTTYALPLLDRYRGDAESDTRDLYDGRLFREEMFLPIVGHVAEQIATVEPSLSAWSLPDPDGRLAGTIAKSVNAIGDAHASAASYAALGDTGAAAVLVGAIGAFAATSGGTTALVAYGGGRASAVSITATAPLAGASSALIAIHAAGTPASYTRMLRNRTQLVSNGETIPMGVPPESALFARGALEMLQMLGGRCVDCGTINTPPSIHPHCIACGGGKMEAVELAREGTVHTYVINYTMPAPFEAPLPIAVIDLDDGSRIMLQVADDGSNVEIGARMRLVLRKYAHERGAPVYGFKAQPLNVAEVAS